MEILLLQDIPGIGKRNDLLVVGDGYALNYLLPRRAALVATPLVRKRYAELIKRRAEEREKEKSARAGAVQALSGKTITFAKKATKTGKLYAAITEKAIVDALKEQLAIEVKEDDLVIDEPIKAIGTTSITVMMGDSKVPVSVKVDGEKA
jgi:large subunit ribosomal protein L9